MKQRRTHYFFNNVAMTMAQPHDNKWDLFLWLDRTNQWFFMGSFNTLKEIRTYLGCIDEVITNGR